MSKLNLKSQLTSTWNDRFQDVSKLNDYARTHPVELSDVKIEKQNIDGAVLNGAQFHNTDWKSVSVKKANLTKTIFRQGTLDSVDFSNSTLTDVVFENVRLVEVRFFHTTLVNVRFVHCTFNGSNIDQTKTSNIEVIDSRVINTSLSEGQLVAVFRNSQLYKGTSLTDLQPPSSLTFEESDLDDVDLSRSVLSDLVLDTVKSNNSGFITGSVRSVVITGGDISFGFSETRIDSLKVHNINSVGLALDDAVVKTMTFSNCREMSSLNLFRAKIGTLDFINCSPNNFRPRVANINTLRIKDGTISNSKLEKMKAKTVILDNVSLSGELNFTDAHIGDLKTKNVTKQPGLKLIIDGSNVKL